MFLYALQTTSHGIEREGWRAEERERIRREREWEERRGREQERKRDKYVWSRSEVDTVTI